MLVPKPGKDHRFLEGWRPICSESTTFKWFEALLWYSLERMLRPLHRGRRGARAEADARRCIMV